MKLSTANILQALLLAVMAAPCPAEGILIKSEPKNQAEVNNFDGTVKFWFSGNVGMRAPAVVVVDAWGKRVDNRDARLVLGERHRLTATTGQLSPGAYAARYRVVTEDGLIVSGVLKFAVLEKAAGAGLQP